MKTLKIALPHLSLTRKILKTFAFEGHTFCLHKSLPMHARNGYKYSVSELGTGRKVSIGTSKNRAINTALGKLKNVFNESPEQFYRVLRFYRKIN